MPRWAGMRHNPDPVQPTAPVRMAMLVTFKSKAAGDVPMYAEHAQALLAVVGKSLEPADAPRGIITAADVPSALAKLKAAADASRRDDKSRPSDDEPGTPITVSLAQRAFPLIEMLERAAKENRDVVWGV
jgi:Domain of unknown function (DUF1840)